MKGWIKAVLAVGVAGTMAKGCEMYEDSVAEDGRREDEAEMQKVDEEREIQRRKTEGWGECRDLFNIKFGRALVPLDINNPNFIEELNLRIELEHPFVSVCDDYYRKTGELPQN